MEFEHVPVLLERVLENLELKPDALVIDCTLGLGGYSEAFLDRFPDWRVVGIDRDADAREIACRRLAPFGERFRALAGDFRDMAAICAQAGISGADAAVFDLGVSNMQLENGERGFSFRHDGRLDMRMDRDSGKASAAELVNTLSREALTEIFRTYGEEKFAWQIAGEIVKEREKAPIETTAQLSDVIRRGIPAPVMRKMSGHPARKVFQALRIAVNDELGALSDGLSGAFGLLSDGGMLIAVTYHSLEDRIVKRRFKEWCDAGKGVLSPKKSIVPDADETERNPKSRSARLRGFRKENVQITEGRTGPWRRY